MKYEELTEDKLREVISKVVKSHNESMYLNAKLNVIFPNIEEADNFDKMMKQGLEDFIKKENYNESLQKSIDEFKQKRKLCGRPRNF
ncbi:MAG: hypothetical protein ACRCXN_12300 [Bacteroidales bacterium]